MEKVVYTGRFVEVKEWEHKGLIWEKVYLLGGIVIYPITKEGKVILIEEFRAHETPQVRLKPVTGIYEKQYSLEENAIREMQEEIGLKADKVELILDTKQSGTINSFQRFVVTTGLSVSKVPNPDGDVIQKILEFSFDELEQKIYSQEIPWSVSLMGLFMVLKNRDKYLP